MDLSISQIKKLGKNIRHNLRENNMVNEDELEKLQSYRISYQTSINIVFDYLVKRSKHHYKGSLIVYRLKRIDTIIRKITRYQTMDLSKMQDIAGCRAIVGSERQIYNIVADFDNNPNFEVIDRNDYVIKPRDTGYTSYHLIVRPINEERFVEIQLRTRSQHLWATLVEITDVIFNIKLKEGEDHPDLYQFHKLLANRGENLSLDNKIQLVEIDRRLDIISKVTSIFKANLYVSIDRWCKALNGKDAQFLIMELDYNLSPVFHFYNEFLEAENSYFQKFARNEPNMVLIHVNQPDFEKIGLAYSNYVLTSHPSIRLYIQILQNLILELRDINLTKAIDYLEYYKSLVNNIISAFDSEITEINTLVDNVISESTIKNNREANEARKNT